MLQEIVFTVGLVCLRGITHLVWCVQDFVWAEKLALRPVHHLGWVCGDGYWHKCICMLTFSKRLQESMYMSALLYGFSWCCWASPCCFNSSRINSGIQLSAEIQVLFISLTWSYNVALVTVYQVSHLLLCVFRLVNPDGGCDNEGCAGESDKPHTSWCGIIQRSSMSKEAGIWTQGSELFWHSE